MINILFSGNDKVFDGVLTCSLSILKRTKSKDAFCFYVMTTDVSYIKPEYVPFSDGQIAFLNDVVKEYNIANEVKKVDVTDLYQREFADCPNELAYCSPYTLLRLLADLIPGMPDKILYLDVDILFQHDVELLYNHDISDYEYAAARDHYGKFLIHPNYINAGVLLLNMRKIRETGLFTKARALLRRKKLLFADQSAIYRSTTGKLMLPQKFNDQKFLHKHTVVRHFSKRLFYLPYPHTANVKQWHLSAMYRAFGYSQFDDILYEYIYLKKKFEKEREVKDE